VTHFSAVRAVKTASALAAAICLVAASACRSDGLAPTEPAVRLVPPVAGEQARIEITGLPGSLLERLRDAPPAPPNWPAIFRVAVAGDGPSMVGEYALAGDTVAFTPAFPFDAGREYQVRFDPAGLIEESDVPPVLARVALPAAATAPTTRVVAVYPSGDTVPENLLRMYVEFSAPMGRDSGVGHVRILDARGREIESPFLPLEYDFWSPDRRRFTLFFDPGRVKDGILPNQQMGRPLHAGQTYTLVIERAWRDGQGQPLVSEFRRVLRVGPARTDPVAPAGWSIAPPDAASRAPLIVTFDGPLDHAILMRALGVRAGASVVRGTAQVDAAETRWSFVPDEPWRPGVHHLLVLPILEDAAGNQIGRAFEVQTAGGAAGLGAPETMRLPFSIPEPGR
jgi:hypothetical protein